MAFWDKWFSKDAPAQSVAGTTDIKALIASGANVNAPDSGGKTPLQRAVETGNLDVVKALLDAGGQIDFNTAATAADDFAAKARAEVSAPAQADASVTLKDDIEVRKPLTFKRKP